MNKIFLFLSLFASVYVGSAQNKFEKEIRIKVETVPQDALVFVDSLHFNKRVKWYKEIGIDRTSIEAKTKYKGKKYSIEFSRDGVLEDIEVNIKWEFIPNLMRSRMKQALESRYAKYKVEKAQIQYIGNPDKQISYINDGIHLEELTINYEVVIHAKIDRAYKKFELLFSSDGELLESAEIVLRNSDNIEY